MRRPGICVAAALLATALFPATANACVAITGSKDRPAPIFWDAPPAAQANEVVLKVRWVGTEPEKPDWPGGSCLPDPYILVFEVVEVAEGSFRPTRIFLADTGAPQNQERTAWLVGKPATLYTSHIFRPGTNDPVPAERPSIIWRTPHCPADLTCQAPRLSLFQP